MTRNEYTNRVLAVMRRATAAEREAIRTELDAHMEDHICGFMELGFDEALAEERTMARMGDPEEVGRELDKQYPMHWLILGRIAVGITVMVCIMAVLGLGVLSHFFWSLEARFFNNGVTSSSFIGECSMDPDIRVKVGNDILRVYRVAVGTKDGEYMAEVAMCVYDRIPGGIASEDALTYGVLYDQRGTGQDRWLGGGGKSNYGADYGNEYIHVQPGDTYVTWIYDRFGEYVSVEIPLPKEVERHD